jgi:hypothetical protein
MARAFRLVLLAHCFCLAVPAAAATLATGVIRLGAGADGESLNCDLVNVGTKPVTVSIRVIGVSPRTVLAENDFELVGGEAALTTVSLGDAEIVYCEFELSGSAKAVRAAGTKEIDGDEAVAYPAH